MAEMYVLWFKFIHGLMFFEPVSISFAIVLVYGNDYMTKENKNLTSFKNFTPKLILNHNLRLGEPVGTMALTMSLVILYFFLDTTLASLEV